MLHREEWRSWWEFPQSLEGVSPREHVRVAYFCHGLQEQRRRWCPRGCIIMGNQRRLYLYSYRNDENSQALADNSRSLYGRHSVILNALRGETRVCGTLENERIVTVRMCEEGES